MHWPGTVEVGTRVEQVGRSSIVLAQALFQEDRCVATAQSVAVLTDITTRRSRSIPPESIQLLQALSRSHPPHVAALAGGLDR
jgi:acyl-CoA thioester hydrolase